ncbi:calreticulin [Chloropicon primus]|uniref:Calreticulin n=1 Tax=Chloropicon primus TaxID=1764295 RepID=A0A5B8MQM1_9CHLO|nr:calreticulin [Chloropicon primus]UPR00813.1 calreticulin [Chloropicon primus]|eukprot:QDZ21602.1 calreticulin [Chloropicon primus]
MVWTKGLGCAALALATLSILSCVEAKVYFEETFPADWEKNWVKSTWKTAEGADGKFVRSAGKYFSDPEKDAGIQTTPDARFYAMTAEMKETFDNTGKDLVFQFSVKHEQKIDCGGGYVKLVPASSADKIADFSGETPYSIMFGPDICGGTKHTHVIFTDKDGVNQLRTNKLTRVATDELTHVYTLIVHPDNTYEVLLDLEEVAKGELEEDWAFLPPKEIHDPEATKPEDWDEREKIPDPEDVKPEDWDVPEMIPDDKAELPEDWDEEEDGEWERPMMKNPEYKGEWTQKLMDNPEYKGKWEAPMIKNPDYVDGSGDELYRYTDLKYIGFELWQVKSGTIFDNILVTDDVEYAKQFAQETWGAMKDIEKKLFDDTKAAEEAEAKARFEEEQAKSEIPVEDDEDDEDDDEVEHDEL